VNIGEVHDGLAVAAYGLGRKTETEMEFKKADDLGQSPERFTRKYVQAAQALAAGSKADCLSALDAITGSKELKGFEKISADRLRVRCQQ
jgi:hypothetical protein